MDEILGVIFEMGENGSLPNHMIYKIRQNGSYTTTTRAVRSSYWYPSPRGWDYSYYTFGFLWIQVRKLSQSAWDPDFHFEALLI